LSRRLSHSSWFRKPELQGSPDATLQQPNSPTARRYGIFLGDLDRERTRSHGIINYSLGLVRSLARSTQSDERIIVIVNDAIGAELDLGGVDRVEIYSIGPSPSGALNRIYIEEFLCSRLVRSLRLDSIHFPKGMRPIRSLPVSVVTSIHDDIPLQYCLGTFGTRRPAIKNSYISLRILNSIWRSHSILTLSDFSAQRLRRFRPRGPVTVTGIGCVRPLEPEERSGKRYEYVLFCSDLPHKATAATLALLSEVNQRERPRKPPLLLGKLPSGLRIDRAVTMPGPLANSQVAEAIRQSEVLIFGSAYEGFGLPPVESWLLDTPAVYPNTEPMVSIMAGIPGSFDPGDSESLSSAIHEVRRLSAYDRSAIADRLAAKCDWGRVASLTLEAYRRSLPVPGQRSVSSRFSQR
jgi:hypothetical protein